MIVGGWKPLPADQIHDELHARCVVLDDGQDKLVFVICDNVGIPREVFDAAKKRVTLTTGIPANHQLMASTHTHSATTARGDNALIANKQFTAYQEFLIERIVDSVRIAHKRLRPARIGWGSVDEASPLFNRRWFVAEEDQRRNPFGEVDQVRMNPSSSSTLIRPAGPVDPEISFLYVRGLDDKPLALLANYSLHYVGGVPPRTVSADYFAVFANRLSALLPANMHDDPPFVAMLSNGTSGDVNNINFRRRGPRRPDFEKMREVGELIANRVHGAISEIAWHEWVDLSANTRELTLQVRKPDTALQTLMQRVEQTPEGEHLHHRHEKIYAERLKGLLAAPETVQIPLQVFRIGELAVHAIPFEVFTETGLELKERTPLADSFTIELASGSFGYLPTPEQHALGGYETWLGTSRVELEASRKIVDCLLQMTHEISD